MLYDHSDLVAFGYEYHKKEIKIHLPIYIKFVLKHCQSQLHKHYQSGFFPSAGFCLVVQFEHTVMLH